MSMKVSTRQVDGVVVMDMSGRITLGEGSVVLRDAVRELLSKGNKKILANLAEVNYIDSSGIGELVSAFTTVKNQGGELKLRESTGRHRAAATGRRCEGHPGQRQSPGAAGIRPR